MGMTVNRRKDVRTARVLMHRIADIRGGVSVKASELGGDFLNEGAVLSAPDAAGLCHVIKVAQVVEDVTASGKAIKVAKGHNFVKGDFVMVSEGSVAYEISSIDGSNATYDLVTVGTTLGAIAKGGFIVEAAAKSTGTDSALKYVPFAINGTGKNFLPSANLDTDAWVMAVTKGNALPEFISAKLKGIVNY